MSLLELNIVTLDCDGFTLKTVLKLLALLMFGAIILSSLFQTKGPMYFEYAIGHVNLMLTVLIIQK